jgi:hypothetical protein
MFKENKDFWHAFRQALLMMVDAIERGLGISPTTADIRQAWKNQILKQKQETSV